VSVFALHFAVTCFLTGLIWFVQVVHYPLFASFELSTFCKSMERHQALTTYVVAPVMLVELWTGGWLFYASGTQSRIAAVNLSLLLINWVVTFLVSVPIHSSLARGFDGGAVKKLVASNWWRTLLWTTRSLLLLTGGPW